MVKSSTKTPNTEVVPGDVTDLTFERDVVQRSYDVPVMVDFWAEWCGPCRMLAPVLEREEAKHEGHVALAKVDVDANGALAGRFRVSGIPSVKVFWRGEVIHEFVGVQPPAIVARIFEALATLVPGGSRSRRPADPTGVRRARVTSRPVSSRARVYAIVVACAVAAAGLTVGITLATRTPTPKRPPVRAGSPPLVLDLGVRTDLQAVALRRAANLYNAGKRSQAATIFARYDSLESRVGAALADWPAGFRKLAMLAAAHPRSALAELNYGLGLYWRGDAGGARAAWRAARTRQPDTSYAQRAEDLLYPRFPRGLPTFVPSFGPPAALDHLSPPRQLAYLRRLAATSGVRGRLLYGVALQRLGHQVSALREFEQAAALAPHDPEPQVAAAVARFDKADPSRTFSRLGPLARRYPRSQSVRFHLGLCLLWLGSVKQARQELGLARGLGPRTELGREASRFLAQLAGIKTR